MPKYTKDPGLNLLANELKNLSWVDPLDDSEMNVVHTLITDRDARRRRVVPLPTFVHWAVRLYLGGEQRTLGIVHNKDVAAAFRFADMAQRFFWKYRVRGCAPPSEGDLNFSTARLDHDMVHECEALNLLRQMEEHLLRVGALKDTETRALEARKRKSERKNLTTTIRINQMEINERLDGLYKVTAEQNHRITMGLDAVGKRLETACNLLQKLIDGYEQLVDVISTPPDCVAPVRQPTYTGGPLVTCTS